jgi:hypothetical protein
VQAGGDMEASLACRRATYDRIAVARPGTQVIDMAAVVSQAGGEDLQSMFRDVVHLSDAGAAHVATWLVPTALALAPPAP